MTERGLSPKESAERRRLSFEDEEERRDPGAPLALTRDHRARLELELVHGGGEALQIVVVERLEEGNRPQAGSAILVDHIPSYQAPPTVAAVAVV